MKSGVFATMEVMGAARERIAEVQRWADPRYAGESPPHVTMIGSSGAGPAPLDTPAARIKELVAPITSDTPPITVSLERPHRFMQTEIIVLPIDPHGPLRTLHEQIRNCGLQFEQPRFPFSPHVTLSFYPTMTREMERRLTAVRIAEPVRLESVRFWRTVEGQGSTMILVLGLLGTADRRSSIV
ncbi:MAG TPA: 2'-5' RNA ligase family protein, partial [Dongiaceae bacterium]|nr:2'-5' RNA ligase family protein [Dongiaceae bacterium]